MTAWLLIGAAFLGYRRTEMPVPVTPAATAGSSPRYVTKAIQDIRPDDLVLARDQDGTNVSLKRVVETYRKTADHLLVLTFIDDRGQSQTLQTTNEHPFWDAGQGVFVAASKLDIGAQVVGPTGEQQRLTASRYEAHPEGVKVFNFQVEGYHTYYVAEPPSADCSLISGMAKAILVHNDCESYAKRVLRKPPQGVVFKMLPLNKYSRQLPGYPVFTKDGMDDTAYAFYHYFHIQDGILRDPAYPKGIEIDEWSKEYARLNNITPDELLTDIGFLPSFYLREPTCYEVIDCGASGIR